LTWGLKKYANNPLLVLLFTNYEILTLSGLGEVWRTSDWSEEKEKSASFGVSFYEQSCWVIVHYEIGNLWNILLVAMILQLFKA